MSRPPTAITVVMAQPSGQDRAALDEPLDVGPFFHGTKADLKPGDLLAPGYGSNSASGRR